jgi:23S rRNA (uracil1939-C5)-methyltransferase
VARKQREPEVATIESVTHDGRGIAAVSGKKVFVAGALEGEEVRFLRRKRRRNFDEAELLDVLRPSSARIEPRCAAFGTCGGCSLQHISDEDQRAIKLGTLVDNLERIGQVVPQRWLPPLFNDDEDGSWHYRRRARLAVKDVAAKGRVLVGFRERHAPYVTNMHRCEVLAHPVDNLIDPLSELIGDLSIRTRLPQIEVAVADNAVTLVFRVLDAPSEDDKSKLAAFGKAYSVQVMLQPGGLDSIAPLDSADPPLALAYRLDEFDVDIGFEGTDFVQVNGPVNERMVKHAIDLLQVGPKQRVLDLYCGIGNFSLPLARHAAQVLGVEGEQRQVDRARDNASRNGIGNCEFRVADLSKIDGTESWLRDDWDRVLLDPARSGAMEIVQRIASIGAQRIVYVSCHPGTLARDAGELVNTHGYQLEAAGIIDMFPHTAHVESIAVFDKSVKK